jgi:hypothetical protein
MALVGAGGESVCQDSDHVFCFTSHHFSSTPQFHISAKPLRWKFLEMDNIKYFSFLRVVRWFSQGPLQRIRQRKRNLKTRYNNHSNRLETSDQRNLKLPPQMSMGGPSIPAAVPSTGASGAYKSRKRARAPREFIPFRQYYHSRSRQPMTDNAWEVDSDDLSRDEGVDDFAEAVSDRQ